MKVLICGADGMIGHGMFNRLRLRHDVKGTLHKGPEQYGTHKCFGEGNVYPHVDIANQDQVTNIINDFSPDIVINATGIVKQRVDGYSKAAVIEINAVVPHRLADLCAQRGAGLVRCARETLGFLASVADGGRSAHVR